MPLWPRRLELMLAQLALVVARHHGNKKVKFSDFDLFAEREKNATMTPEHGAIMLGTMAGGVGFRKLGQGRKTKVQ